MKTWRPKGWIFAGVDRCSPPVDSIRRRTSRSDASRFGQNDHGVAKEFATAYTFGTLSLMKRLFIFKVGQQKQLFSQAILKVMAVIWGFFTWWKGDSGTLESCNFENCRIPGSPKPCVQWTPPRRPEVERGRDCIASQSSMHPHFVGIFLLNWFFITFFSSGNTLQIWSIPGRFFDFSAG